MSDEVWDAFFSDEDLTDRDPGDENDWRDEDQEEYDAEHPVFEWDPNDPDFQRVLMLIEQGHMVVHMMEQEITKDSETVLVAMNERDFVLLGMSLPIMQISFPCLGAESEDLQKRLVELVRAQKPEWIRKDYDGSEG